MKKILSYLGIFASSFLLLMLIDSLTGKFQITVTEVVLSSSIAIVMSIFLAWLDKKDGAVIPYTMEEIFTASLIKRFVFYFVMVAIFDAIVNPSTIKNGELLSTFNLLENALLSIMLIGLKIVQGKKTKLKITI